MEPADEALADRIYHMRQKFEAEVGHLLAKHIHEYYGDHTSFWQQALRASILCASQPTWKQRRMWPSTAELESIRARDLRRRT